MGAGLAIGAMALLWLLGGSGRARARSSSGSPGARSSMAVGPVRTTRDVQAARLGIDPDLWDDLLRMVRSSAWRSREQWRGPRTAAAAVTDLVQSARAHAAADDVAWLATEAEWARDHGRQVAAAWLFSLARGVEINVGPVTFED